MPIRIHRTATLHIVLAAALSACAGWPCAAWPAGAGPLLEDGFDGENRERPVLMYERFTHWRVEGGTVDLVGAGSDWDFQPGNGLYVDLDGDRPDGVRFEPGVLVSREAFSLAAGTYQLSFRLAGSQRGDTNTVEIRLGNVHRERITLPSDAPFGDYVRDVRVHTPQAARLSFANSGADGFGLLLDDVVLRRVR